MWPNQLWGLRSRASRLTGRKGAWWGVGGAWKTPVGTARPWSHLPSQTLTRWPPLTELSLRHLGALWTPLSGTHWGFFSTVPWRLLLPRLPAGSRSLNGGPWLSILASLTFGSGRHVMLPLPRHARPASRHSLGLPHVTTCPSPSRPGSPRFFLCPLSLREPSSPQMPTNPRFMSFDSAAHLTSPLGRINTSD